MSTAARHEIRALLRAHLSAATGYRHLTRHCPVCARLLRLAMEPRGGAAGTTAADSAARPPARPATGPSTAPEGSPRTDPASPGTKASALRAPLAAPAGDESPSAR
ncbi:hypothetical protein CP973_02390 [Streptomyces albofaciens JCM 4342]|uniref:DUF6274 family protein n=1 Tax=Streptomyces albofaciens TaxID=66866 RepID=UPI00123BCEAB|nr:DUF6274 family protein [Streptomyces albofaciens]KAA6220977.1 hypothetical protein CP973_02390 [Streptomyces albofaciens JCM 4342]